ncbi:DUF4012 domain-containing protein [Mangrovihabitans endophyticus]|uniref:DUF4012 domain-containing protein n=1 Tax=Mangrovihabitans endophyticus TaxID=1751298 RepID=A0A8J3C1E6_9ACTN|nr:DUF4012 domain-containing protein [Mangrovihabitans endophyticus]GGL04436.1 hypothetical protein GCM10012284_43790 [Mangrovihabitans endophyticus]
MQNEDQPGGTPEEQKAGGPERYAFEAPQRPSGVEFKKVRRAVAPGAQPRKTAKGRRRWPLITAAAVMLIVLVWAGMVAVQGVRAKGHLETAAGLFSQMQQQLQRGDLAAAEGTLAALRAETRAAHEQTTGVAWSAASHVPLVGDDLAAVSQVAAVLDVLASDALGSLLDAAKGLDPQSLAPQSGRVDLAPVVAAGPRIAAGLASIRSARQRLAGVDTGGLMGPVRTAVEQLGDGLARAEQVAATADRAAKLLPVMLGADGPRTYLVLFQNNAEVRATGGMPGAYIVVKADAGAIRIADQGSAARDLKVFDPPVQDLGEDLTALYTDRPAVFPADVNLTPDFPTAAALARDMYRKRTGVAVDGVLATDPVALSYLLKVTGAVTMPQGEPLTADNAVRLLLSEAYAKYPDPTDQDDYFAGAARATFDALLAGRGDPKGLLAQMARAAGERRLLMWSARPDEQATLAGTVLEGRLPEEDKDAPTVGVFLNDGGGSKLSYYLTEAATLTAGDCAEDGGRLLTLKLTLGSTAPAAGLPAYVRGLALSGDPHTSRTNVMVFSPTQGGILSVTSGGQEVDLGSGIERGRMVGVITVDLPPGASQTYEVTLLTGPLDAAQTTVTPHLWTTPGVRPWDTRVDAGGACRPNV